MVRRVKRRWIAILIGVCLLGFLARNGIVVHEQRRIIKRVRKAGGQVLVYDPFVSTTTPRPLCNRIDLALDTLGRLFMVPNEIELDLREAHVNSELLSDVGRLVQVRSLYLAGPGITDETLSYVAHLTGLRRLSLVGTRVTGSGLRYLVGLPNLEDLDLAECPVDDSGLKYLDELRSLRVLDLTGTKVTDRIWSKLHNPVHLDCLIVVGTNTTTQRMLWSGKRPRYCYVVMSGDRL